MVDCVVKLDNPIISESKEELKKYLTDTRNYIVEVKD
jgi:hypothetical protein